MVYAPGHRDITVSGLGHAQRRTINVHIQASYTAAVVLWFSLLRLGSWYRAWSYARDMTRISDTPLNESGACISNRRYE